VAGGRHHARTTDVHREYQLARHLVLFPVPQEVRFGDSLSIL
jgi:hypothetical protein